MKTTPTKTESRRVIGSLWSVVLSLSLAGAAMADDAPTPLPEGAIKVEEGLFQVPIGRDDDGCMMYRMHAPGRDVIQVISYRRADGTFTMAKREAACDKTEK